MLTLKLINKLLKKPGFLNTGFFFNSKNMVEYDSYLKTCKNGYPQFYGVTLDPVTGIENKTEITFDEYISGYPEGNKRCPPAGTFVQNNNPRSNKNTVKILSDYDYYLKSCKNGYPQFYGVKIDPATGTETTFQITGSEYIAGIPDGNLECPPKGNYMQPSYKPKFNNLRKLQDYNLKLGLKQKLNKKGIEKLLRLTKKRDAILGYLRTKNIVPKDKNNLIQLATLLIAATPQAAAKMNRRDLDILLDPKNGNIEKFFDFGAVIQAGLDLANEIAEGVNQGNQAALANEQQAIMVKYDEYMATDFRDIQNQVTKYGPPAGLSWLVHLKTSSWSELKAYIKNLWEGRGQAIPESFKKYWKDQENLETVLKEQSGSAVYPMPNNCRPEAGTDIDGEFNYNCNTKVPVGQPINNTITGSGDTINPITGQTEGSGSKNIFGSLNMNTILLIVGGLAVGYFLFFKKKR